ncbi:MAG: hypothetical protein D4R73_07060 [Deltaproteobacteria bacterium]|nr:MAG: hypothetical protein D4R73_07060 [Deltaproteobacteria bacterium]
MTWSQEIAKAYSLGLKDGKSGRDPRQDQDFAAAYAEGYLHGGNQVDFADLAASDQLINRIPDQHIY